MGATKFIQNQHGFSLLEMMVAIAISSVVSMTTMTLITNQVNASRNVEVKAAIGDVTEELQSILSNETTCAKAVKMPPSRGLAKGNYPERSNLQIRLGDEWVTQKAQLRDYPLRVVDIYAENFRAAGTNSQNESVFLADVKAKFSPKATIAKNGKIINDKFILNEYKTRSVSSVFFSVNAAGTVTACSTATPDSLTLVEVCRYMQGTPNLTQGVCMLPVRTNTIIAAAGPDRQGGNSPGAGSGGNGAGGATSK